jgi:predicted nucleotidyltransferase
MKNTSLKISNKLDEASSHLYAFISDTFDVLSFPYLIVGARARDLIFESVYQIKCPRATLDTDLAVMLNSWAEYSKVKEKFIDNADFSTILGVEHRLCSPSYGIIDFIPFGPISNDNKISWPPEYSSMINVLGFKDAYECSVFIEIDNRTSIRCCTSTGLVILKLLALADRRLTKDADDLAFIMMNYLRAGHHERIYENLEEFMTDDFDYDCAGTRLLGKDIISVTSPSCRIQLVEILNSEIQGEKYFTLATSLSKLNLSFDDNFNRSIQLMTILLEELKSI